MKPLFLTILSAAFVLSVTSPAPAQTTHAFIWSSATGMIDLGTLGGTYSVATAINDSGQVVGYADLDSGFNRAFIWSQATGMVDIGTLGGNNSIAFDINSTGSITGQSDLPNGKALAFYWSSSGGFVSFGQPNYFTEGDGINDSNAIVGQRFGATTDGFIWDPETGVSRALGWVPRAISSIGTDINNLGHVVGIAGFSDGAHHVFYWTRRNGAHDLGSPAGAFDSRPSSINDNDEIVGFSDTGPNGTAFYWSRSAGFRTLEPLTQGDTLAYEINNAGNIVGHSASPNGYHAVLWPDSLSAPQDLGTLPGDIYSEAKGINNLGQVVGSSTGP